VTEKVFACGMLAHKLEMSSFQVHNDQRRRRPQRISLESKKIGNEEKWVEDSAKEGPKDKRSGGKSLFQQLTVSQR
jgi:hypothetical protein